MKIKTHKDSSVSDAFWFIVAIFAVSMIVGIACYGLPTAHASQHVETHQISPAYQAKYDAVRVNSDRLLNQKHITVTQLKKITKQANNLAEKYPAQESNLAVRHLAEDFGSKYVVKTDNGRLYTIYSKIIDYSHAGHLSKKMTYKLMPTHEKTDKEWLDKHTKDAY